MSLSKSLMLWYAGHRRELPWRGETDPYKIWVSEIILQQTRVRQGWDYYLRFIEAFPTVESLAAAPLEKVLKIWQGLGYYSRARNMHAAAQQIRKEHAGIFPADYALIRSLQGIGDYTAAAIASIAFQLPYPAVDGNVVRVISRLYGIHEDTASAKTKKIIAEKCQALMRGNDPGEFNQALMDFGSLQCLPKNPDCEACPLTELCRAYRQGVVDLLPVKKNNLRIKTRYFHYFIFLKEGRTVLQQRQEGDIWSKLFQFPLIEGEGEGDVSVEEKLCALGHAPVPDWSAKHQLSHQLLCLSFYLVPVENFPVWGDGNLVVDLDRMEEYPFPVVIARAVEQLLR